MRKPEVDWTRTWEMMNSRGLDAEKTTFLFKLLHNILPLNSRLHRMNILESPFCSHCPHNIGEDSCHAFLACDYNGYANDWIITALIDIDDSLAHEELTPSNIATLNFNVAPETRLSVVWFLASVFPLIWEARKLRKPVSVFKMSRTIAADIAILRNTKHQKAANKIELALHFSF